jgi:hypothetical protein
MLSSPAPPSHSWSSRSMNKHRRVPSILRCGIARRRVVREPFERSSVGRPRPQQSQGAIGVSCWHRPSMPTRPVFNLSLEQDFTQVAAVRLGGLLVASKAKSYRAQVSRPTFEGCRRSDRPALQSPGANLPMATAVGTSPSGAMSPVTNDTQRVEPRLPPSPRRGQLMAKTSESEPTQPYRL